LHCRSAVVGRSSRVRNKKVYPTIYLFRPEYAFHIVTASCRSWGSSVSIVSDYGLDGVRSLVEKKVFSSSVIAQTSSEAHPASYPVGNRGPFPEGKLLPGDDAYHAPHLVPSSRMSRSYTASPPLRLLCGSGITLTVPRDAAGRKEVTQHPAVGLKLEVARWAYVDMQALVWCHKTYGYVNDKSVSTTLVPLAYHFLIICFLLPISWPFF
jgi:hypothetical protein